MKIETRVAVADELEGHGVHAGDAVPVAQGELGKLAVVPLWKVSPNFEDLRLEEMKVVEQPLRRRSNWLSTANVGRQNLVGVAENARVLVQAI
jgi:hypothetical protein